MATMTAKRPVGRPPSPKTALKRQVEAVIKSGGAPEVIGKPRGKQVSMRYEAAGTGRRMAGWNPPTSGPNTALAGLQTIRNRSRDTSRNDWSGKSGTQKWSTALIGIGITPRFKRITDEAKKTKVVDLFNDWVKQADADCVLNLYGLQTLIVKTWFMGGEAFVRRRARFLDEGLPVPMQIQVLAPEMCPVDLNVESGFDKLPVGNVIKSGIEFDKRGKRIAFWFFKDHPGEGSTKFTYGADQYIRVAASDVCHVFEPEEPGQLRGVPNLAPVMARLRNIENYDDAVLERQKLANMFVAFIEQILPKADENGEVIDPMTGMPVLAGDSSPLLPLAPGLMQELDPGQKVTFGNPPEAGTNYSEYMRTQHMGTAAAAGIPYELFSGDILNISDRSMRIVINEFRRFAEQRQWQIIIPQACDKISTWFADAALLADLIALGDYDDVRRVEHQPHGWAHIHPVQDPQGKQIEVDAGFISRSSVIAGKGDDAAEVDLERQADDERQQKLKIGPYSEATALEQQSAGGFGGGGGSSGEPVKSLQERQFRQAWQREQLRRAEHENDILDVQSRRMREGPAPREPDPLAIANLELTNRIITMLTDEAPGA